ncbi:MAG: uroporphyrinogen decarboxylase family protein [Planctomycetota bacterium]
MTKRPILTGRERVLLALAHKETDRIPIAMVCSGINEPARREFADRLRRERGLDLDAFLDATLDIAGVGPQYAGAALAADTDIWGVRRQAVSYGASSYSQNGLLMLLAMWEEFIKPCHVRLNRAIHEFGARVIYHSDGAVMEAVPGLIDMGIDILQALQFDAAGMDPVGLKELYGRDLCFEGGVSVQKTLPFGTPEDVAAETTRLMRVLGKGGGYILGPSHAIQAGTPPANIMAMFDAALGRAPVA